jgi:hypothetical protein
MKQNKVLVAHLTLHVIVKGLIRSKLYHAYLHITDSLKCMQKGDDLGKFRQLDEILFIDGYPGYQQLTSLVENCMQVVCEVKGSILVYLLLTTSVWYLAMLTI